MKELIERSYKAIRKRGLITDNTSIQEFIDKIQEEFDELKIEFEKGVFLGVPNEPFYEELIDLITVGIMLLRHHNIDFENKFEKVVIKNEKRALKKS